MWKEAITQSLNHSITHSWSWALLEKPPIVQPLMNFPAFYGTRRFITVFTRALHWSLSWARSIPSYLSKTERSNQGLIWGTIPSCADHSSRAVWGMNCVRSLEGWDRGFESHSRHGCLYRVCLFCVCVVLCVGSGLATGWSPVQGVLPTVYRIKKLKKWPRSNKGL
jgi:hypothetical protein